MIASALVCAACARSCSPSVARPASASATSRNEFWIERSYWAAAMLKLTRAASRLAWLRPASKSGCSSCAVPVKANEPPLNRPERSPLAVPRLAVSVMRGKNAARAAPMLALLASSWRSAARMSGRRSSRSEGRPGGTSARDLLRAERQRRRQVGRQRLADQQLQRVLVERALAQRLGERRLRAFEQRLGLAVVELRRRAVVEAQLVDARRLLARRQRVARDAQLLVVGEQRQVGVGDRRDQADLDRLAGLGGREVLRQRRLAQVVDAPEQVELVARKGEADGIHGRDAVADRRRAKRTRRCRSSAARRHAGSGRSPAPARC